MPAEHAMGPAEGTRLGVFPIVHTLQVNFNSKVDRKFLRVRASPAQPVLLTLREVGQVAFNAGTTNQYRIGTASAGAQLLALRNTPAANAQTEVALISVVLTANTDIWVGLSLTGTAASAGSMWIHMTLTELNVKDVNPNAIP